MAVPNPNNPPQAQEPVLAGNTFSFAWYTWFASKVGQLLQTLSPNVPANSGAPGRPGQAAYDQNYIYICTGTNTWKRAALSAF
jgi:hypothetical protein